MPGFEGYDLWHNENGSITFQCTPTLAGTYRILVEHDGVPLQGLPVCCVVQEAGEGFVTAYKAGPEADMDMDITPNVNTVVEHVEDGHQTDQGSERKAPDEIPSTEQEEDCLVGAVAMEITDIPEEIEDIKPIVDLGVIVPDGSKYILEKAPADPETDGQDAPVYILKEQDLSDLDMTEHDPETVDNAADVTFDPADVPVTFIKPADEASQVVRSATITPQMMSPEGQMMPEGLSIEQSQDHSIANPATPQRTLDPDPMDPESASPDHGIDARSFFRSPASAPMFRRVNIKASELNAQTFSNNDMPIFVGPKPSPGHRKVNYDVVKMAELASKVPQTPPTPPRSKIMIMNKELTIEPIEIDEATRSLIASIPDASHFGGAMELGTGVNQAAEIKYEFIESTTGNPAEGTSAILVVPDDIEREPMSDGNDVNGESIVMVKPDPDLAPDHAADEEVEEPAPEDPAPAEDPSPARRSRRVSARIRRTFRCRKAGCGEMFSNQKELDEHNSTHNEKGIYVCPVLTCKRVFTIKKNLKSHRKKVHEQDTADEDENQEETKSEAKDKEEQVACTVKQCKKAFDSLEDMKMHVDTDHSEKEKRFMCKECGRICMNGIALKKHQEVHRDVMPFECKEDGCGRQFKTQKLYDLHLSRHLKGLWCTRCCKAFKSQESMDRHNFKLHKPKKRKLDVPEDSLDCPTCGKTLGNRNSLQKHIINVHGDTRYQCNICDKFCKTKENMDRHQKTHLNIKPFMCDFCGQFFKSKDILRCHKEGMHKTEQVWEVPVGSDKPVLVERTARPFSCKYCDRTFKRKAVLKEHIAIHESTVEVRCTHPGCDKVFPTATLMKTHIRSVHKFKVSNQPCKQPGCGKVFKTSSALSVHMNSHLNIRFQCIQEGCELSFTTKHHMLMHYQLKHTKMDKNYACSLCGKRFCLKEQVKAHLDSHKTERVYSCDVCGKGFTTKSRLTSHAKIHRSQGDHVCQQCGQSFIRKYRLLDHMTKHAKHVVQYEYVTVANV